MELESTAILQIQLRNCGLKSYPPYHFFPTQRVEKVEKSVTELHICREKCFCCTPRQNMCNGTLSPNLESIMKGAFVVELAY